MAYHRILNIVPCAMQPCCLSIYIYDNLHLLILNSHSIPPPPSLPLGNHKSLLSVLTNIFSHSIIYIK